jgi:hypothetical protein
VNFAGQIGKENIFHLVNPPKNLFKQTQCQNRPIRPASRRIFEDNPLIHWRKPWLPSAFCRTKTHDVQDGGAF